MKKISTKNVVGQKNFLSTIVFNPWNFVIVAQFHSIFVECHQKFSLWQLSDLYYKHITIVIDAASVISKWRSKL
jgi:hypothetical protein